MLRRTSIQVINALTDEEWRQIMTESRPREACDTMIAAPADFETVTSTFEVDRSGS